MPTTPNSGLRYPSSTDDVRPYEDIQFLATDTDNALKAINDRTPQSANVDTLQSTSSTTYADLTTPGPSVSINMTGTSAIVTVTAYMSNSAGNNNYIGVAVSGASTIAASDPKAASMVGTTPVTASATFKVAGLTPGVNTFKAVYRVSGGGGNFVYRNITVTPLP
jgi:hypothetical protein